MSHKNILIFILALLIGLVLGYSLSIARTGTVPERAADDQAPPMNHSMHRMMGDMASNLDAKTGRAFDLAFLDEMIAHHEGAVRMAQQVLDKSQNQALRDFADAIIAAQGAEIEQMKTWKAEWSQNATTTQAQ